MKRYSPLILIVAAIALIAALRKADSDSLPEETWTPVEPS